MADVIVGGVDDDGGAIYNIDLFGSLTKDNFHSTGSGSPVAFGILESECKDNLTVDEAISISTKAINAAILRNAGTGDGFDIVIITKDRYRELSKEEKDAALKNIRGIPS